MRRNVVDKYGRPVKIDKQGVPVRSFHAIKSLIVFIIVVLIIIGIIVGAVFVLGDIAVKGLTDGKYSYNDARIALNNIGDYRQVEQNELDNPFAASDADAFTNALADALFLKEFNASDVKEIMDALAEDIAKSLNGNANEETNSIDAILSDEEDEDGEENGGSAINGILKELLDKLFTVENIDSDKIKNYSDDNIASYSISASDKSMAAFLNETVLNSFLNNKSLKDAIAENVTNTVAEALSGLTGPVEPSKAVDLSGFDYKDILQIRQITFYSNGTGEDAKAGVKFITQTNVKSIVNTLFKEINGENFLRKEASGMAKFGFNSIVFFAKSLIKGMLPDKLYVTVDIPVASDEKPLISLNGTTRQDYENIMGILSAMSGNEDNFKDPLEDMFGEGSEVDNAIRSMNETMPIKDTIVMTGKSGAIKFDAINLALELSGVNTIKDEDGSKQRKPEEDRVTNKDVYLLLKTITGADTEAAMDAMSDYTKHLPKAGEGGSYVYEDGGFRYIDGDPLRQLTEINDDYQEALFDAFKRTYGLNNTVENFNELFEIITKGNTDEFIKLFDSGKIKEIVNGDAVGVKLDALMLAALISAQTHKFLGEGEDFNLSSVKPRYVTLYTRQSEGITHNMMEVGIEIALADLLEKMLPSGDSFVNIILNRMMAALVPASMLVRAEIDITTDDVDFAYLSSQFAFDLLEYGETQRLIKLLDGLASDERGFMGFLDDMLLPVRVMINMMAGSLPGLTIGESDIVMPDLYELLASALQDKLTPDEVEQVLKGVYFDSEGNAWFDLNGEDKTEMNVLISQKLAGIDGLDSINNRYLEITFTDSELASMINGQLPENYNGALSSVIILAKEDTSDNAADLRLQLSGFDEGDYTDADYMIITVKVNFSALGYGDSFSSFMPEDFYVTLLYEMNGKELTLKWYRFNDMDEDTQKLLYEFLGFENLDNVLGGGESNVGGGYFQVLASLVFNAIDTSTNSKISAGGESRGTVSYSYKNSDGEGVLGMLVVSVEILPA